MSPTVGSEGTRSSFAGSIGETYPVLDKVGAENGRPSGPMGPHAHVAADTARERFALDLLDALWQIYRERVPPVKVYERLIASAGGIFVNDHLAFRTIAAQAPSTGIVSISRVFEALGYNPAGCYQFPDKHLSSIHFQHANRAFPKLFISELRAWELDRPARRIIERTLVSHRAPVRDKTLTALARIEKVSARDGAKLLKRLVRFFTRLPWDPPRAKDIEVINKTSQFAAWALVHGYAVNHFTALINSHANTPYSDIERTADALRAAGVGMKGEIEGAPGSKLRQTATEAAMTEVRVRGGKMPWTYAYFELAERGVVTDPLTGLTARFEGFLGPQATQLFEMTRVKS